jgi:hypothetical protein
MGHLAQVCMTYAEHALFSLALAMLFAIGFVGAVVHAVLPNTLVHSSTWCVELIRFRIRNAGCRKDAGGQRARRQGPGSPARAAVSLPPPATM